MIDIIVMLLVYSTSRISVTHDLSSNEIITQHICLILDFCCYTVKTYIWKNLTFSEYIREYMLLLDRLSYCTRRPEGWKWTQRLCGNKHRKSFEEPLKVRPVSSNNLTFCFRNRNDCFVDTRSNFGIKISKKRDITLAFSYQS